MAVEPIALTQHALTAGATLAVGFAAFLVTRRTYPGAHRWLAFFFVCLGLQAFAESIGIAAREEPLLLRWQILAAWSAPALAPALFLYVQHLLQQPQWRPALIAVHFAPAIAVLAMTAWVPFVQVDPLWWHQAATQRQAPLDAVARFFLLQWASYAVWSWRLLQRFRHQLEGQYSLLESRRMTWLGALILSLPALALLWVAVRLGPPWLGMAIDTLYVPMTVAVFATWALRQPEVFLDALPDDSAARVAMPTGFAHPPDAGDVRESDRSLAREPAEPAGLGESATAPSAREPTRDAAALPAAETARLQAALADVLATERPYLQEDLTLAQLAALLQTTTHRLSQFLNQQAGMSFYELVNRRRIAEVQRCLSDAAFDAQTILDIAMNSGFSSKATFNTAFKKYSGVTPREYRVARRGTAFEVEARVA